MRIYCAIDCLWPPLTRLWGMVAGLILICSPAGWASSVAPTGHGAPVFTRQGEEIRVSLIPRAKSTSVHIDFGATGGALTAVTAKPFESLAGSGADEKDFKSGVFVIQVADMTVGGTARISVFSDFFSVSTEYWIFNDHQDVPWNKAEIESKAHDDRVQELILMVTDGGALDADHSVDGQITVVGGPWDSFWGYALGTLFIRFFGIFLVLSVLMIGMMTSGKIFAILAKREGRSGRVPLRGVPAPAESTPPSTNDAQPPAADRIAAMSLALHRHFAWLRTQAVMRLDAPVTAAWIQQGRQRATGARCFGIWNRKPSGLAQK